MRGGGATTPGGNYSTGTTGAGGPVGRNAVAGSGGTWKDVWRAQVLELIARPEWVMDGNYGGTPWSP
ncbi:MAG: hypothetical protein EBV53_09795, partial [Proteobacteria bacterium]|nr:hypothetical protein [Pseudomonadota bacterium]